ncbi:hypothetical protein K6K41_14290 [Chenggangzhangella methanolivorans]|uniref:Uncharacterized protein n=1 Tax=Chenggangzhangella methanolivorans TaxID=1437009 RepID=A0A9E6UPM2_9HYPH|nr:hypothetical protein K6K41_14290 [Chenggangzhangella methanolivorans]
MIAAFFAGAPVAGAAIVGAGVLLVTRRLKPARIWREIDFPLLVMFCGLFVVTAALRKIAMTPDVLAVVDGLPLDARRRSRSSRPRCPTSSATCRRCWCSSRSWSGSPTLSAPGSSSRCRRRSPATSRWSGRSRT